MEHTFFFYDLETSGLNPRRDRIMQFAGQRTTLDFEPIGQPINVRMALTDDVIPSLQALMVTKVTPQESQSGLSEVELAQLLRQEVFTPGTIALGYNTIRFDDEFIRNLFWRTFYDAYDWTWREERSRWDLLDVTRMTRALRPEGLQWPVNEFGEPINTLESLAVANSLEQDQAHDALSDIQATIAWAAKLKSLQPQIFDYLFRLRDKSEVAKLINLSDPQPLVYTSGRYGRKNLFTTVALPVAAGSNSSEVIVYDTRYSISSLTDVAPQVIYDGLFGSYEQRQSGPVVPFKRLKINACPALAPLSVLSTHEGWARLELSLEEVERHIHELKNAPHIVDLVEEAFASRPEYKPSLDVDERLYDGFLNDSDRQKAAKIPQLSASQLVDYQPVFDDERLPKLLLHYKARYFPSSLSRDEGVAWSEYIRQRLLRQLPDYFEQLESFNRQAMTEQDLAILEAAEAWVDEVVPADLLSEASLQADS